VAIAQESGKIRRNTEKRDMAYPIRGVQFHKGTPAIIPEAMLNIGINLPILGTPSVGPPYRGEKKLHRRERVEL
jgi:hypothetical protein